jgi:hypothetical protein
MAYQMKNYQTVHYLSYHILLLKQLLLLVSQIKLHLLCTGDFKDSLSAVFLNTKLLISDSDDSTYVFQTPKLKKVETNDSDIEMSLEQNIEESSTNNTNYGIYFEKSQIIRIFRFSCSPCDKL